MLTNDRLWVGTGNGVVLSVPLVAARPARDDGETPTSSPGTGGSGGPGGAVRVYSNEGKDGDTPRGSSFMPYCSMVSRVKYSPVSQSPLQSFILVLLRNTSLYEQWERTVRRLGITWTSGVLHLQQNF